MAELEPIELQWFNAQRNRANQAHDLGFYQNKYERKLSDGQSGWQREDLIRNFSRQQETFANPWNRRGMVGSGMYQSALARMNADYQENLKRQRTGTTWKSEGYDLAGSQLATVRDDALKELEDQKREYLKTRATTLSAYQGGY